MPGNRGFWTLRRDADKRRAVTTIDANGAAIIVVLVARCSSAGTSLTREFMQIRGKQGDDSSLSVFARCSCVAS
jgi:hypothetical protein